MVFRFACRPARRALAAGSAATGLIAVGALGAVATGVDTPGVTVTAATAFSYRAVAVAPVTLPDGSAVANSIAEGISDFASVAGNAAAAGQDPRPFLTTGTRRTWLPVTSPSRMGLPTATDVAPNGRVAANFGSPNRVAGRWNAVGVLTTMQESEGTYDGSSGTAINRSGQVAACQNTVKSGFPAVWSAEGVPSFPFLPRSGNCRITGLSDAGAATVTLTPPAFRHDGKFPNAYLVTNTEVESLTPGDPTGVATADAISPSGRYVVGRVGGSAQTPGVAAWLSTTAQPVALEGAAEFVPSDVDNSGRVVGSVSGRGAVWADGRLTDLTSSVRGLSSAWTIVAAEGINSHGDIAATARNSATGATMALRLMKS